jgi:hypothetical protein
MREGGGGLQFILICWCDHSIVSVFLNFMYEGFSYSHDLFGGGRIFINTDCMYVEIVLVHGGIQD